MKRRLSLKVVIRQLQKHHQPSWSQMWIEEEEQANLNHPIIILFTAWLDVLRIWRQRYSRT
jgi:hypothetical protein